MGCAVQDAQAAQKVVTAARAAATAGDHAAALRWWQALHDIGPDHHADALCGLAEAHLALENYAEALDAVAACTALAPHHGPLRHLRARILGRATQRVELRLRPLLARSGVAITLPVSVLMRRELGSAMVRVHLRPPRGAVAQLVLDQAGTGLRHQALTMPVAATGRRFGLRRLWCRLLQAHDVTLRVDLRGVRQIGLAVTDAQGDARTVWTHMVERSEVPTCLEGRDGWLFLTNDGNRSDEIFTGGLQLAPWRRLAWVHYGWRLMRAMRQPGQAGVKLAFVIAPSKESALPQVYPLTRGRHILSDSVVAILRRAGVPLVFPVERLARTAGSYCRTDTHWSHAGAFAALEECLTLFDLPGDWRAQIDFVPLEVMGDLGGKVSPPVTDDMLVARWPGPQTAQNVYRSGLVTTGEIAIFENPDAAVQEVLVVFGGSSASTLAYLASRIFRRVVRINCPSTQPVLEVIAAEGAAYVICQTNERYLQRAPRVVRSLSDSAIPAAVAALDGPTRLRVEAACAAADEDNPYARFLAECLAAAPKASDPSA